MSPIGIFDTGRGGQLVAAKLSQRLPNHTFITVDDVSNAPYGLKSNDQIVRLANQAIQPLVTQGCKLIIIACNTATTIAINSLRQRYPEIAFIGFEPMVKPAAEQTLTKHIMILATPATLHSQRYSKLKKTYAEGVTCIEPDCHDWASLIQQGRAHEIDLATIVDRAKRDDCDRIVLGCTHYLALEDLLLQLLPSGICVMEPTDAVTKRLQEILGAAV